MPQSFEERVEQRLDRLEDANVDRGNTILKINETITQTLLPASVIAAQGTKDNADQIRTIQLELATARGGLRMLTIVGGVLVTILTLALGFLAWKWP